MKRKLLLLSCLTLICTLTFSQEKSLKAFKISQAPKIDGSLDDAAWQNAPVLTDFIQNTPNVGNPSTQKTEVRVVYDNTGIYVAAKLYDDPALIRKQITARDEEMQKDVDYFSVFFDTYHDKQNGFQFTVTSANVQTDARLGPNLGNANGGFGPLGDNTWDAVWESKVQIQNDGWTVEMRIPFISLRFAKKDLQDWGIQFQRQIRRLNETSYWNDVKPQVNGFVNQFGLMQGLENLQPPLRLSFSPYVSTGYRTTPEWDGSRTNNWLRSGGMDVKYGVNESFTLDATLIPDYGQVVSDNAVNNLTPYEVKFTENRPFFTEGIEIFNKAGLFYSRRVGATPTKYNTIRNFAAANTNWEIVKNPSVTQLYNAAKFSGRNPGKLGVGIFNAVTAPMHAKLHNRITGKDSTIETEPLANYNIIVLDQALKGRSSVTFTNTNVLRNGSNRDANVSAIDFSLFDKKNTFNIKGAARYSRVYNGSPTEGYATSLQLGKVSGNWQYSVREIIESPYYNSNDLGYLLAPNEVTTIGSLAYKIFKPSQSLLQHNYTFYTKYTRLYKPSAYSDVLVRGTAFWLFKNFWDVTIESGFVPAQHDYFVLSRDPAAYQRFVKRPSYGYMQLSGSTDSRKKLYFGTDILFADFFNSAPNKYYHRLSGSLRYRFSNKFSLELYHRDERETDYIISAGMSSTSQPVVAFVDFNDNESILSGIYNFTPRINLTVRMRHYLSRLGFNRYADVDINGNTTTRSGTRTYDNVNLFNTDAFLTWDFRLGSRLILGYKNWLGDDEVVSLTGNNNYIRNLGKSFNLRHGNEFTVRFIYFLDYNQLRGRR